MNSIALHAASNLNGAQVSTSHEGWVSQSVELIAVFVCSSTLASSPLFICLGATAEHVIDQIVCIQLTVTGGGSANPSGLRFPGSYRVRGYFELKS